MTDCHTRALALPDGPRRWATFGRLLHCLQDSYSPAHTERVDGRIVRMRHWGPFDGLRRAWSATGEADEHGFPTDPRDSAWRDGHLTDEAQAAVTASRHYLEFVAGKRTLSLGAFLDEVVPLPEQA